MSKRPSGETVSNDALKRVKFDDFDDFWDENFDDNIFNNLTTTHTPSYNAFKAPQNVITSTQLPATSADESIKELKERYFEKEGEVSILRSNLESLRASCMTDLERKQSEWKGKIETIEKENKTIRSELEFKNIEIVNLKQKLNELVRFNTQADLSCTQRIPSTDSVSIVRKLEALDIGSRICINSSKSYPMKPYGAIFRLPNEKDVGGLSAFNLNIFKSYDLNVGVFYNELPLVIIMPLNELTCESALPFIKPIVQFLATLLQTIKDNLIRGRTEKVLRKPTLKNLLEGCCHLLEVFEELFFYNRYIRKYCLEDQTGNIFQLIFEILTQLDNLSSNLYPLVFENHLNVLSNCLSLETCGFSFDNVMKDITIPLSVQCDLKAQVTFLNICSRNHSLISFVCSKDNCRFLSFVSFLEEKLLESEDVKFFSEIGCNVVNLSYNIFRRDNLMLQEDNKICLCVCKLLKLVVKIVYKMLKFDFYTDKLKLLEKHIKFLIYVIFVYDFSQESVCTYAVLKEIVYLLGKLSIRVDSLENLEKLCDKEDFPVVPKEKFMTIEF